MTTTAVTTKDTHKAIKPAAASSNIFSLCKLKYHHPPSLANTRTKQSNLQVLVLKSTVVQQLLSMIEVTIRLIIRERERMREENKKRENKIYEIFRILLFSTSLRVILSF